MKNVQQIILFVFIIGFLYKNSAIMHVFKEAVCLKEPLKLNRLSSQAKCRKTGRGGRSLRYQFTQKS